MPRADMLMVFSYDIASDTLRRRVAALLEAEMVRVQKSVFEAYLSQAETEALAAKIRAQLEEGDSLRIYAVCRDGRRRSSAQGGLPLAEQGDFYLL